MANTQADGSVRLDIIFKTEQAKKEWEDFEQYTIKSANNLQKEIDKISKKKTSLITNKKQINEDIKNVDRQMKEIESKYKEIAEGLTKHSGTYEKNLSLFTSADSDYTKLQAQMDSLKNKRAEINKQLDLENEKLAKNMTAYDIISQNEELQRQRQADKKIELQQINDEYKKMQISAEVDKKVSDATAKNTKDIKNNMKDTSKETANTSRHTKSIEKSSGRFKNNMKNVTSAVSSGIKKLARYMLAFVGIRGIVTGISQAIRSYMASDSKEAQQLKADLDAIKTNLGNAIAPLAKTILNIFYQILGVVGALVKAFSGIDIFAKNTAKSTGQTAKNASNTLASFDKIDVLQQDTDGGEAGGISPTDIDAIANKYEKLANQIKDTFEAILEPIKKAWASDGQPLIDSVIRVYENLKSLISGIGESIFNVWRNGTGEQIARNILNIVTEIFNVIGNIVNALDHAWRNNSNGEKIIQNLANHFNNLLGIVKTLLQYIDELTQSPFFQEVLDFVVEKMAKISEWISKISSKIYEFVKSDSFKTLMEKVVPLWQDLFNVIRDLWIILEPFVDFLIDNLIPAFELFADILKPIYDTLALILELLDALLNWDFGKMQNAFSKYVDNLTEDIEKSSNPFLTGGVFGIATSTMKKNLKEQKKVVKAYGDELNSLSLFSEKTSNFISNKWEDLENNTNSAFSEINRTFSKTGNEILNNTSKTFGNQKATVENTLNQTKNVANSLFSQILQNTMSTNSKISQNTATEFNNVKNNMISPLEDAKNKVNSKLDELRNQTALKSNQIKDGIVSPFNQMKNELNNAIDSAKNNGINSFENMKNGMKTSLNDLAYSYNQTLNGMNNKTPFNQIITKFEGVANNTRKGFQAAYSTVTGVLAKLGVADINLAGLSGYVSFQKLARGGIVAQATPAIVGEAGKEAIIPLENNTEGLDMLAEKLGGTGNINIKFTGELSELVRILKPQIERENNRVGKNLIGGVA